MVGLFQRLHLKNSSLSVPTLLVRNKAWFSRPSHGMRSQMMMMMMMMMMMIIIIIIVVVVVIIIIINFPIKILYRILMAFIAY